MGTPHHKISYAQNFEDLLLAGILKRVERGFYVDIGARHPEHDSVTRFFYARGWSGVNVEPNPVLHALLSAQRPRDANLASGLASQPGQASLSSCADGNAHSASTQDDKIEARQRAERFPDVDIEVTCLAVLLAAWRPEGDIHFLKVDAERLDLEILLGNDWQRFRPWVLCLGRNPDPARYAAIGAFLSAHHYEAVFFDGMNDFLVPAERVALWQEFSYSGDVIFNGVPVNHVFVPSSRPLEQLLAMDDQAFVDHAYATLLHRAPDPSGGAFYLGELKSGVTKVSILHALATSDEGRACKAELPGLEALSRPQAPAPRTLLRRLLRR